MYQRRKHLILATLVVMGLLCSPTWAYDVASDPDLLGWWSCDEGAGAAVADTSGNGNDGAFVNGDPVWTEGFRGSAVELTGPTLVEIPALDITISEATFAGWMKPYGSQPDWSSFIMTRDPATGFNILGFQLAYHWNNTASSWSFRGGDMIPDNEWTFAAVSVFPDRAVFYVNGEEGATNTVDHSAHLINANVYLGGDGTDAWVGRRMVGALDDMSFFSRALTGDEILAVMDGLSDPAIAADPSPANEATDVPYTTDLSWAASQYAATHDVYLGTNIDDVNAASVDNPLDVLAAEGLTETSLALDDLALETTFFWRVDEVNAPPDKTVFKGKIWSFTTEPVAYPIEGVIVTASSVHAPDMEPTKTIDGSGLNADDQHSPDIATMWLSNMAETEGVWIQYDLGKVHKLDRVHVWNHNTQTESILGYGIKEALIETSTDGETWTELKTTEIAQASGTSDYAGAPVPLDGAMAQYVRITALSNYSILGLTQFGLAEVRFYSIPVLAREPMPADNGTSDGADVLLGWRAGRESVQHEVSFSDDMQAVADGSAVVGTVDDPSFDVGILDLGHTYYWKINEMNDLGTPPNYEGDLWTFQTPDQIMIDDFERYKAEQGLFIWEHWVDGFQDDENGSIVGNDSDYPETSIVYEGNQSLPMVYDNSAAPKSEATRTFDPPLDLTTGNPESVELYFRGQMYKFNGYYSVDGTSWTLMGWSPQYVIMSEDALIGMALTSHDVATPATAEYSDVATTGGVTGDWTQTDIGGVHPNEMFTEVGGIFTISAMGADIWNAADDFRYVHKSLTGEGSITAQVLSVENTNAWTKAGVMIRDAAIPESSFAMVAATPASQQGVRYQARLEEAVGATADDSALDGTQEIMDPPVWIRMERKLANSAAPIYMTLTDSSGKSATIETDDPAATQATLWTALGAAPGDLNVNLTQIESITVGVGVSGAQGTIYVDAVRTSKPYPEPAPTE